MWLVALVLVVSPLAVAPSTASAGTLTCPPREELVYEFANQDVPQDAYPLVQKVIGNVQVTSGYGYRDSTNVGTTHNGREFHYGLDFVAMRWTPVYAPLDGTARHVTLSDGNRIVVLTLSNGIRWWFLHLQQQIASGPVKAGTILGKTGDSGYGGEHLHIEVTTDGNLGGPMTSNVPPEWWACKSGGASAVEGTAPVASADFTDDFNRAGPEVGNGWTTGGTAQITNNQLVLSNGYIVRDTGKTSGYGSFIVPTGTTAQGERWLVFRWQDSQNYWLWGDTSGFGHQLWKVVGGNFIQLKAATTQAVAGEKVWASWTPTEVKVGVNDATLFTTGDTAFAGATSAGIRTRNSNQIFDNWGFAQNPDGSLTASTPGTEGDPGTDTPTAGSDGSVWNPIGWLADELKGIFIPDADDWKEIAAALGELTDREPVGTIKDVAQFVDSQRVLVKAPTGVVAATGAVASDGYGGAAAQLVNVQVVMAQAREFSNHLAGIFAGMKLGGVNFQEIVKITIDIGMVVTFIQYLQSRVKVQA